MAGLLPSFAYQRNPPPPYRPDEDPNEMDAAALPAQPPPDPAPGPPPPPQGPLPGPPPPSLARAPGGDMPQSYVDNQGGPPPSPPIGPPPPVAPPPPVQAAPPGPPQPGQQEQTYRDMLDSGPRKSVLGRIAAGAIGAAAGYSNAAGRARQINLDPQKMRDMVNRNPNGGGPYDAALARQRVLTEEEQGQTARTTAWQQQQAVQANARRQNEAAMVRANAAAQQAKTSEEWRKSQAVQAAANEADKKAAAEATRNNNMQKITPAEARDHGIAVSPEEEAQGYVTVHRALWTRVATQDAKPAPPAKVMNRDAWIQQMMENAPGSEKHITAKAAVKIYDDAARANHPVSTTAGDKELTRKTKTYVGGLESKYGSDWEQIRSAINTDKAISDTMRAEATAYALKMGGRPKANKDPFAKIKQLSGASGGRGNTVVAPPPVGGGVHPDPGGFR